MSRERWRKLEELYHTASNLTIDERKALLERSDPELRATVESMLAATSETSERGFLLDDPLLECLTPTAVIITTGTQLGPYHIDHPIGQGGMGEVFRATDTRLNRTVAIKIAKVQFTNRFERETKAIATLNHPHIATLYDIGVSPEGVSYLVMEYVEGPTLADLIHKGPIAPQEVRHIALQTAEAIEAAHEKGIIHRDLKPANIKLAKGNLVKVLDFGLAKAMNEAQSILPAEATQEGLVLGTPSYMSPEQALGGVIDRRSDIWSFGTVVAEMLSGKPLFSGRTTSEILDLVVRGDPDLSKFPLEWQPLLRRCLTKDVRRRLQAIGEARLALEDGLATVVVDKGLPRWPWIAVAMASLLFSLVLWIYRAPARPLENPLANAVFTPLTDYDGTESDASISPDGNFVAFLSDRSGVSHIFLDRIGVGGPVDLTPGQEDQRGPLRTIGFSRDGAEIWIAGTERRRLRLLPLLGGAPRMFLGEKAVNPVWSPDGTKVAYHTFDPGDSIFIAESDGSNPHEILRDLPDKHNHYLAWGEEGNWIYYVHGTPATFETDLWRIPATGGKPERLTTQNSDLRDPTPIGNKTVLYIGTEHDGSGPWLWSLELSHKTSHRIAFGLEQYTSLSASKDGRRLAVTVSNPTVRLWSVPIRDSVVGEADVKPFPPESRRVMAPRFKGGVLYYLSSVGTGDRLWRLEGSKSTEIWGAGQSGLIEPPALSPDGAQIALVTRKNGQRRLRLINADGTDSSTIAPELEVEGSADWSPDGRWIVTGGRDGHGRGLFKIASAGGTPIRLTKAVGRNPVWSPDGALIAYSGPNVFTFEPLLAVRPDGTPVKLPEIRTHRDGERVRFMPDGRSLVYMQAGEATPWQDFWLLNLTTMKTRRLTELNARATMRTFDITPTGTEIVFDRQRENAAVVLIDTLVKR